MLEAIQHLFPANKDNGLEKFVHQKGYLGEILFPTPDINAIRQAKVALLSLDETRGAAPRTFTSVSDEIRYWLYQLSQINRTNIVDLGSVKPGNTLNDSYTILQSIVADLVALNVIPVIIGGSNDLALPILRGLKHQLSGANIALIDSRFDVEETAKISAQSFVHHLYSEFDRQCHVNIVGYQSYFITTAQYDFLNDKGADLVRLGNVRSQMNEIEPLLRDCDFVAFDVNALRQAECPAASTPGPNGLYTEEACQLANLAGLSDQLKVFSMHELASNAGNGLSAHLSAQILWHFIYGVSQRKGDYPACDLNQYKKIFVKIDRLDFDLIFYQNEQNNRFWVEIPAGKSNKNKVISCSETDYIALCHNQIPDRIWRNIRLTMEE